MYNKPIFLGLSNDDVGSYLFSFERSEISLKLFFENWILHNMIFLLKSHIYDFIISDCN